MPSGRCPPTSSLTSPLWSITRRRPSVHAPRSARATRTSRASRIVVIDLTAQILGHQQQHRRHRRDLPGRAAGSPDRSATGCAAEHPRSPFDAARRAARRRQAECQVGAPGCSSVQFVRKLLAVVADLARSASAQDLISLIETADPAQLQRRVVEALGSAASGDLGVLARLLEPLRTVPAITPRHCLRCHDDFDPSINHGYACRVPHRQEPESSISYAA